MALFSEQANWLPIKCLFLKFHNKLLSDTFDLWKTPSVSKFTKLSWQSSFPWCLLYLRKKEKERFLISFGSLEPFTVSFVPHLSAFYQMNQRRILYRLFFNFQILFQRWLAKGLCTWITLTYRIPKNRCLIVKICSYWSQSSGWCWDCDN